MTLISLICLFVLTASAYGRSVYGGYGAEIIPQTPKVWPTMPETAVFPQPAVVSQGYGQSGSHQAQETLINQGAQQSSFGGYSAPEVSLPKTLPTYNYGPAPVVPQFEQPQIPLPVMTEADIRCQGQRPEAIITLENPRKFVVCLDDGKGVEQECPKGLVYHIETQRCERKLGPLDNACASQPCLNGGQCIPQGSSFQCQCTQGYDGTTCELDARICQYQYPCGQGPDTKCQSFRAGAALQYICIFQDGYAYGLNAQQIVPSPCQGNDGPQALSVANTGFIMCDGERMFVESCPGGTLWDDVSKACSWPDMQTPPPQQDQSNYGYSSYTEQPKIVPQAPYGTALPAPKLVPSYAAALPTPKLVPSYGVAIPTPKLVSSYGAAMITPKLVSSYGAAMITPKLVPSYGAALPKPKLVSSYGAAIPTPKLAPSYGAALPTPPPPAPRLVPSYGAALPTPPPPAPRLVPSYGAALPTPPPPAPRLVPSYGAALPTPPPPAPRLVPSYGAALPTPPAPRLAPSYGAETMTSSTFELPKTIQSYSGQMIAPKITEETQTSQYGAEIRDESSSFKQTASY